MVNKNVEGYFYVQNNFQSVFSIALEPHTRLAAALTFIKLSAKSWLANEVLEESCLAYLMNRHSFLIQNNLNRLSRMKLVRLIIFL